MKMLNRFLAVAVAAFFVAGSALAQTSGTVTNHAFAIGKGAGTGYTSLLCGSAQLAVGQSAADPICKTITGDVTITAAGVTAIGATKVTSAMLNADVFSTAHSWAGQQTFVAPILGTPASGTLTNATGLPISTGVSGLGTGVATALGVNVGTAGAVVVNGGALGTPSSGTLTSATGLPVSTGISGLGTGVATFLATPSSANLRAALTDEVGSGAAYFVGGALGTPASGTATNLTGLPLSGLTAQGAYTIIANNSGSSAVPTAVDIPTITAKASPVSADIILIQDSAASNAFKRTTVGALATAGSVASIAGNTGAFTLAYPLGNVVNDIRYIGPTESGQLTYTSTTAVAFKPYKGDTIKINGVVMQIPSAGIAGLGAPTSVFLNGVAAQTLAINTTYYIYAFSNAGTVTADFSTTGHSVSATAGNVGTEIKTGDDTRSLIGMVRTGGTVIYASDLQTASWFNRRNKAANLAQSLAAAGNTTAINFVTWAEEAVSIGLVGVMTNSVSNVTGLDNQIDGTRVGTQFQGLVGTGGMGVNNAYVLSTTEGNHVFLGALSAAGGTPSVAATSFVMIRG